MPSFGAGVWWLVGFSKTDYDSQAVTNLAMDMKNAKGETLRRLTFQKNKLPQLSNQYLANNLGISILILTQDGHPMIPLRDKVAIYPNEWGCTSSFAADFPDRPADEISFSQLLQTALVNQLKNEFKLEYSGDIPLVPLALTRDWFRGGKPQLFMFYKSPFEFQEVVGRLNTAPHNRESAKGFWGSSKILGYGNHRHTPSIELLANWGLLLKYIDHQQKTQP